MSVKRVLVFGGTHGNEWTGVFAIKEWANQLKNLFPELDLSFILANPEAFALNKRFRDEDLNRAFQFLNESRTSYEHLRAREIKLLIDSGPCFVLDLHTTTSAMGNTLIIAHPDPVNFAIARFVSEKVPETRIILSPDPERKYLASQSTFGLMIEVGPVANGVLHSRALEGTLQLIKAVLEALSTLPTHPKGEVELYEEIEDVFYPKCENQEIRAYIHADFQDKDFVPLNGKYTPFKTFEGENIERKTSETLYPIFINEAAYYPTGLAFTLCRKRILKFDASLQ